MVRVTRGHENTAVSRRRMLALIGGAAGAAILAACGDEVVSVPTPTTAPRPTTGGVATVGAGAASAVAPTTAGVASAVATTAASAVVATVGGASAVAPTATRAASAVAGATTAPATTGAASAVTPATIGAASAVVPAVTGVASAVAPTSASAAVSTPTRAASAVTGTTTMGSAVAGTTATVSASANVIPTLDIESFDYGYRTVLGAVPGGWTLVRQRNTGKEPHHVQFARLRDGVTQVQLLAALMGANAEPAIAMLTENVGGPGAIDPGGVSEAIIDLRAGTHFLLCYIPSPSDGVPHLAKGMVLPLQVTPGPATAARLPVTVGTVTMSDFAFQMPVSTVQPGKSYWNVTNVGVQPHEFIVVRLLPGKTPTDITSFVSGPQMGGPPPFTSAGGIQGLERGMSGIAVLDLPVGEYAAVCNIPDPMSRKSHLQLGMIAGLSVR